MSWRRSLAVAAAVVSGAVLVLSFATRPPRRVPLDATPPPGVILARGAFHVHTIRSDGVGTVDEVSRAAADAGLAFVILTDHGDGTRAPDPPAYHHGVLCIDSVELSTSQGHLVALGLPATPFPLAGDAADVVEDARRMGAMVVATHPESPKAELAWREWEAPIDGLEWVNVDSEWRDDRGLPIATAFWRYLWRPTESMVPLIDDTARALARWDRLTAGRRVVGLAGVDAHGGLALETRDAATGEYKAKPLLRIPSYRALFRLVDNTALLAGPPSGDATADAAATVDAIRRGRLSATIGGEAGPGWTVMSATSGGQRAWMGDTLWPTGALRIEVRTNAPAGSHIFIKRNRTIVHSGAAPSLTVVVAPERGAFRAEVWLAGGRAAGRAPWGVTNPIYVGYPPDESAVSAGRWTVAPGDATPSTASVPLRGGDAVGKWHAESDPTSRVSWSVDAQGPPESLAVDVTLGRGGTAGPPYGAVAIPVATGSMRAADAILFEASADQPCRLSVQLRASDPSADRRWRRAVYLDSIRRSFRVPVAALRDIRPGGQAPAAADLARVDSLLLVVDTTGLRPGARRTIRLSVPRQGPAS